MEEFAKKVLNFPVLVQGILACFLFWLLYESAKLLVAGLIRVLSKFNKQIRKELLAARMFHHAHSLIGANEKSSKEFSYIISLYMGANRLIHAIIYICIGLIAQNFVGTFSAIPFTIAIGYLFIAMRTVHVDFGPSKSKEYHLKEFNKISKAWDSLDKPVQAAAPQER